MTKVKADSQIILVLLLASMSLCLVHCTKAMKVRPADSNSTGTGSTGSGPAGAGPGSSAFPEYTAEGTINSGLRRLSNIEYDNTIALVLEDTTGPAAASITAEATVPFDNFVSAQSPSQSLIGNLEQIATGITQRLLADNTRRLRVLGCNGSSPSDSACMRTVATRVGRLLFRRPLAASEIDQLSALAIAASTAAQSFDEGLDVLLKVLLQDPRFLYRLEESRTQPSSIGIRNASKLSFTIWGSGPDDALLRLAESGKLASKADVTTAAQSMLNSPRAIAQAQRFHALWFSYKTLVIEESLFKSMRAEADAMVSRVLFAEGRPWIDILSTTQTTVTGPIAAIYEIPGITGSTPSLVAMPPDRKGILSIPAVLAVGSKFDDTSPTHRGKFIRERLMCTPIPQPPPGLNVDAPPPPTGTGRNCKTDRYLAHQQQGTSCFGCHRLMDPVGFGLERYDKLGKLRSFDYHSDGSENQECPIDGNGEIDGVGTFNGPAQLADRLKESGEIEDCLVKSQLEFVTGRAVSSSDTALMNELKTKVQSGTYQQLILSIVLSDAFLGTLPGGGQ